MLQGLPEAPNTMRSRAACGLAVVVLCGASIPLFAQEDDAESAGQAAAEVAPGDYQQALAPYGAWVDDGSYGHVWQPAVGEEWQPYVDGSWAWTGDGWTWESDEPWGWTLHYGRWALSPVFGWVWVPGDVWGPAWVDWFSGDGFVGWAPLSPFGGVVVSNFVFVEAANFAEPNLKRAVLDGNHVPRHFIDDPGARHRRPTLGQIARVSHHPVRLEGRPRQTLAPWDRRGESPEPRSAGVRQPEMSPPGSAMALASGAPSTDLNARGVGIPHTCASGTARTRPALAVGVRSRGPGVSREPVECAGGGLATPARAGGRLRASRRDIPARSHGVPPSPHEIHAIGCGRSAAPAARWGHAAPVTRAVFRPAFVRRL